MAIPPLTGFEHAKLVIEGQESDPIECWFNPKEYSIAKQNTWNVKPVVGAGLPNIQFGGGQPRKLILDLLFDSTDSGSLDVADVTKQLFLAMEVDKKFAGHGKNSARPPMITFTWGSVVTFKAYCDSLSIQFTLFDIDGTPLRASAKISLIQADKALDGSSGKGSAKGQNPTTRARAGLGSHTVRDGDSLASIAWEHYRDPTRWRAIAHENGIDDPLHLRRGSVLAIPKVEE